MKDKLKRIFEEKGYKLSQLQLDQFEKYYHFLISENEKYNLTAITTEDEVIVKHFLDSVLGERFIRKDAHIIDVGSGAGFPGLPLKIVRPDISLVMIDSLQKRVNFLNACIGKLGLSQVAAVHARAEDYAAKNREKFDVATSRAVAETTTLAEYLLPFVKVGGSVVMYKSNKADEEAAVAEFAIQTLGGKLRGIETITLNENTRKFVIIDKIKTTPIKYPRGKNLPKLKPLKKQP